MIQKFKRQIDNALEQINKIYKDKNVEPIKVRGVEIRKGRYVIIVQNDYMSESDSYFELDYNGNVKPLTLG